MSRKRVKLTVSRMYIAAKLTIWGRFRHFAKASTLRPELPAKHQKSPSLPLALQKPIPRLDLAKEQNRETDGKYAFGGNLNRLCICGHDSGRSFWRKSIQLHFLLFAGK